MKGLSAFLAAIDTPGGHMLGCFVLIFIGVFIVKMGITSQGDALISGAAAAIFMAMKGQNGSKMRLESPTSTSVVTTPPTKPPVAPDASNEK